MPGLPFADERLESVQTRPKGQNGRLTRVCALTRGGFSSLEHASLLLSRRPVQARRPSREGQGELVTKSVPRTATGPSWARIVLNAVRGALIGTAETVPGVSGGTVALIVGVYEALIISAGHLFSGIRRAVVDLPKGRGWDRANAEFRSVRWGVVLPVLVGMVFAVLVMARFMEGFVANYPIQSRALFFGLVLASLWVPLSMAARASRPRPDRAAWGGRNLTIAVVAAIVTYLVVSLPPSDVAATPFVIVPAAMVAVAALVLPGLSGSFILLTFGLYEPTLSALNDRDLGYVGLFLLGAMIGLASIVKLLQWLLEHREQITLVVLTGVMAGSLRALWPWQNDNREFITPDANLGAGILMFAMGFLVVVAVLVIERRFLSRGPDDDVSMEQTQQIPRS